MDNFYAIIEVKSGRRALFKYFHMIPECYSCNRGLINLLAGVALEGPPPTSLIVPPFLTFSSSHHSSPPLGPIQNVDIYTHDARNIILTSLKKYKILW